MDINQSKEEPEISEVRPHRKGLAIWVTIGLVIHFLLLGTGISGYLNLIDQKIKDYPNTGQLNLYVISPAILMLLDILLLVFRKRLHSIALWLLVPFSIFLSMITLFFWTGGI